MKDFPLTTLYPQNLRERLHSALHPGRLLHTKRFIYSTQVEQSGRGAQFHFEHATCLINANPAVPSKAVQGGLFRIAEFAISVCLGFVEFHVVCVQARIAPTPVIVEDRSYLIVPCPLVVFGRPEPLDGVLLTITSRRHRQRQTG